MLLRMFWMSAFIFALMLTGCSSNGSTGAGLGLGQGDDALDDVVVEEGEDTTVVAPAPGDGVEVTGFAAEMLNAVNAERAAQGLPALTWDPLLEQAALGHTDDMNANDFLGHTGSDGSTPAERVSATGYVWSSVRENVAVGYPNITEVMVAWMNSPGHRANILATGISEMGAARIGDYWTQVFASPFGGSSAKVDQPLNDG